MLACRAVLSIVRASIVCSSVLVLSSALKCWGLLFSAALRAYTSLRLRLATCPSGYGPDICCGKHLVMLARPGESSTSGSFDFPFALMLSLFLGSGSWVCYVRLLHNSSHLLFQCVTYVLWIRVLECCNGVDWSWNWHDDGFNLPWGSWSCANLSCLYELLLYFLHRCFQLWQIPFAEP